MDADLQDPPEVIDKFLDKWEQGYEIVYGIIKKREGISFIRNLVNVIFYNFLNFVTKGMLPKNATTFRLIDRKVVAALNQMKESNRYTRGLSIWTGFRQIGVDFIRAPRFSGVSKGHFWHIYKLACNAIFAFTYLPLRVITVMGIFISCFSFLFLLAQLIMFVFIGRIVPGYATIIVIILFMFGVLFFMLGIIGEYLSRIYDEVKNRPLYIVWDEIGFDKKGEGR
jgi:dolichol-phosphate mannosyltransferase